MRQRIARALAVVVVVASATAFTATPAAAHDLDTDQFQVTLRSDGDHYEDQGRKGPSMGDYFVFREKVFHRGNRVGRDNGRCDVTRAGPGRFALHCTVTVSLRGRGQIAMQGLLAFRRGQPGNSLNLAITGGTGIYSHASGTAALVERRGMPARLRIDMR